VRGETIPSYYLLCHQIEFCEYVRNRAQQIILGHQKAKKESSEALDQLKREQQTITDTLNREWHASASFALSTTWLPVSSR